jgi:hypothetical protein
MPRPTDILNRIADLSGEDPSDPNVGVAEIKGIRSPASQDLVLGTQSATNRVLVQRPLAQHVAPQPMFFDDFIGDSINTFNWLLTQSGTPTGAGAISATAGDPVPGHGGWIAGATDDVDAEADELAAGASATAGQWRASRAGSGMLICEWALTIPGALTARQYFAGLSDDATEGSGAIAIIVVTTTVTDTATDAAGWFFGSGATDATHWLGVSTDSNAQSGITQGPLAAADTRIILRTEVDSAGEVFFWANGVYHGTSTTGISNDVLLVPYFGAAPTTTTAVPWEVDYCFVTCPR